MRLIITRPLEDADRQAKAVRALGHEALIYPLLEIAYPPLTPLQLKGVQALVATSGNALRGLAQNEALEAAKALPIFCVAQKTADFARHIGFRNVITGGGTAKTIVPLISHAMRPSGGALLYLTGRHLAFDMETPLKKIGFAVPRVIIYEANEIDQGSAAKLARTVRKGVDGIILMSPRTAATFVKLIKNFKLEQEARRITCYCYSQAIAEPLSGVQGLTVAVSSHPTEDDMMKLIGPVPFSSNSLADLESVLGKR